MATDLEIRPDVNDDATGQSVTPDEGSMTMMEHLTELRDRLIKAALAVVLGLIVAIAPTPPPDAAGQWVNAVSRVAHLLAVPVGGLQNLQVIEPGEVFFAYFKIGMIIAISLALPVILYQTVMFVLPALLPHEKKYLWMLLPGATFSFLVGVTFGYLFILPAAIGFLRNFDLGGVIVNWRLEAYLETVSTLLFWMGVAFEMPLAIYFLSKLRVLNVERLKKFRKYAVVLAFVVGAVITPTPDPFNQTLVSLPLYLLFEIGILLARLA
ncbi:MAG: twin-arginine translocase subunit TatC [Chloroflexi bacterium]|nr:twin-arginine translocase subunit TatC [Chloroflexota bacterium]